jgi:hypothetical protein
MQGKFLLKTMWASNFLLYIYIAYLLLWKIDASWQMKSIDYQWSFIQFSDYLMLGLSVLFAIITSIYCIALWHAHRLGIMYNKQLDDLMKEVTKPEGEDK